MEPRGLPPLVKALGAGLAVGVGGEEVAAGAEVVVHGAERGARLGFPTANLHPQNRVIPRNGVYVTATLIDGQWRRSVTNIGTRPTFGGGLRTLEVYLLDFDGDLYGRDLTVAFADWLRPEQAFPGPEALVSAMRADVDVARERLVTLGAPVD